jgi:hypothetical protein
MKKQNYLLGYFLLAGAVCNAQTAYWAGNMKLYRLDSCRKNSIQVSAGFGFSKPTPLTRAKINAQHTKGIFAGVYLPLGTHKTSSEEKNNLGLHIGVSYAMGSGNFNADSNLRINIAGQRQVPSIAAVSSGRQGSVIISAAIGPQFNIWLNRVFVSPILDAGFVQLHQPAFRVQQTSTVVVNATGQDTTLILNLYEQGKIKKGGIAFLPMLRAGYSTGRLNFLAEAQYIFGPSLQTSASVFVPRGPANPPSGNYTLNQIRQGTRVDAESDTIDYQSWSISLGVSINLQRCRKKPRENCGCTGQ